MPEQTDTTSNEPDLVEVLAAIRRGHLMVVRYIEKLNLRSVPPELRDFFDMERRAHYQVIRAIDRQCGFKPTRTKKREMRSRKKSRR